MPERLSTTPDRFATLSSATMTRGRYSAPAAPGRLREWGEDAATSGAGAAGGTTVGARRALNVVVALLGIVITFPLWVLIAIAIKLTSRGPVFYTQTRVGIDVRQRGNAKPDSRRRKDLGGRPFPIVKFRTMTVEAEQETGAVWAQKNDPRLTPVGRFLRQYRLDELPQFINVLRGEMNIVGPRPERPEIWEQLRVQVPGYASRQRTLPGITGHAQINLEYDSTIEDVERKVRYDLEYLHRAGWWEDFKIMAMTVPVVLFRRGSR